MTEDTHKALADEMPDRLYAWAHQNKGFLCVSNPPSIEHVEYVRADRVEALEQEVEDLKTKNIELQMIAYPRTLRHKPSTSQEVSGPRCKHCGHEKGEHKGEDAMSPGCLHVLPDDPGDDKTRYYCTCPGYDG